MHRLWRMLPQKIGCTQCAGVAQRHRTQGMHTHSHLHVCYHFSLLLHFHACPSRDISVQKLLSPSSFVSQRIAVQRAPLCLPCWIHFRFLCASMSHCACPFALKAGDILVHRSLFVSRSIRIMCFTKGVGGGGLICYIS